MGYRYNSNSREQQEKEYKKAWVLTIVFGGVALLCWMTWMYNIFNGQNHNALYQQNGMGIGQKDNTFSFLIIGAPFVICGLLAKYFYSQTQILKVTKVGRSTIQNDISTLGDEYSILNDIELTHVGKSTIFDSIIINEYGIFIVFTVNRNGKITGAVADQKWVQHKIGRKGTPYSSTFTNPLKTVYFQQKFLEEFLIDNGIPKKVEGYVVMPMADYVQCEDYKMAQSNKDLIEKIKHKKTKTISNEELDNIVHLLIDAQ